jgi:protein Mpv17
VYRKLVQANPVPDKAMTSGVAYALGDLLAQRFQGRSNATVDLKRVLRSGTAGFFVHGPLCHYWMLAADQYLVRASVGVCV